MTNDKSRLDKIFQHIETYNREMGGVLVSIKKIEENQGTIFTKLSDMERKIDDAIVSASKAIPAWVTIILGILMATIGWLVSRL